MAAILDSKIVAIMAFSNYVDVKLIYVNKIGQTYIVTRHINQVCALHKVEAIITEEFSELIRFNGGHLELLKLLVTPPHHPRYFYVDPKDK